MILRNSPRKTETYAHSKPPGFRGEERLHQVRPTFIVNTRTTVHNVNLDALV